MDSLLFESSEAFHAWLLQNHETHPGVWLCFGKKGGPKTLSAAQALEEALCFGWIDGQMKSQGDEQYIKYFSKRKPSSKWSEKNKTAALSLIQQGRMLPPGLAAIERAKEGGCWDYERPAPIGQEDIHRLLQALEPHALALEHFAAMSPSVQRTYAMAFREVKSQEAQAKRLAWIVDRLNKNLKPM